MRPSTFRFSVLASALVIMMAMPCAISPTWVLESPNTPLAEASGAPPPLRPIVAYAVQHDTSPALRDLAFHPFKTSGAPREIPLHPLPKSLPRSGALTGTAGGDPVVQSRPGALNMPGPIQNFEGIGNRNGVLPPDTQGDIGYDPSTSRKYYVQWVNLSYAIWDVTGIPTQVLSPTNGNTLWSGFGGPCETTNDGDPITLYDPLAHRWFMSQFALPSNTGPFYQCIAVSQTADPTGSWYRYSYWWLNGNSQDVMNDYPKFGVWPDGYYMTANQFANATSSAPFVGVGVAVFERDKMLSGQSARMVYYDLFSVNPNFSSILPSDLDGLIPPPAGAPNYFAEVDDSTWIGPTDALRIWEFHVDWTNTANSTFGINGQPNATLPVANFVPLCTTTTSCIPQPSTSQRVDAIGDRLMHRLAYRNFGDHEALVMNHTVDAGSGRAGIRWYEVRDPGGSPTIYQQGTYAPNDTEHRWMGSLAMDHNSDIALGYSVSSGTVYPSIRYTGRLIGDPLGQMAQGEAIIITGTGSQTSSSGRWGDYSMMAVDPLDDCTFWYTQEYYQATSSSGWQTRISSFKFPACSVDVALDPLADTRSGVPGATVTFTLRVTNTGSLSDTINLAYLGNAWPVTLLSGSGSLLLPPSVTLAAGAGVDVMVHVTIPTTATGGMSDTVTVTATSQGDPTPSAASMLTTVALYRTYLPLVFRD